MSHQRTDDKNIHKTEEAVMGSFSCWNPIHVLLATTETHILFSFTYPFSFHYMKGD